MIPKARAGSLELDAPHKVGTKYLYRTEDPREAIEAENYFLECHQHLAPMDQIEVYRVFDEGWDHGTFMVLVAGWDRVAVQRMGTWSTFDPGRTAKPDEEGAGEEAAAPEVRSQIDGVLTVGKKRDKYVVTDPAGNVLFESSKKAAAEAYARTHGNLAA